MDHSTQFTVCGIIYVLFQLCTIAVMIYVFSKVRTIWRKPTMLALLICINLSQPVGILFCYFSYEERKVPAFVFDQLITALRDEVLLLTAQRLTDMLERISVLPSLFQSFLQIYIVAHVALYASDTVIECVFYPDHVDDKGKAFYWIYPWPAQVFILLLYLVVLMKLLANLSGALRMQFKLGLVLLAVGHALRAIINLLNTAVLGDDVGTNDLIAEVVVETTIFYFLIVIVQENDERRNRKAHASSSSYSSQQKQPLTGAANSGDSV